MEKWALPPNWSWVALSELSVAFGGSTPSRSRSEYFGGDIVWITPSDLAIGSLIQDVADSAVKLTQAGLDSCAARLLPIGSVLFSSRATIGKIAIAGVPLATNQGFVNFECGPRLFNRYLAYCLRSLINHIKQLASSTTYLEVPRSKLRSFTIPIPYPDDPARSLVEQRRIVARLEALLGEVREMRTLQAEIETDVGRLMEASVAQAFEDGIRDDWMWTTVGELMVGMPQYGTSRKPNSDRLGVPVLRMGNIQDGEIDLTNLKHVDMPKSEAEKYRIRHGDLVFNRTNSAELVGKTAVFESEEPAVCASYLIRFQVDPTRTVPQYVSFYINSPLGRKYIETQLVRAIGQVNVNAQKLRAMPIPIPATLSQQHAVVENLRYLREEVKSMRTVQVGAVGLLDTIEGSILAQAFRGEL